MVLLYHWELKLGSSTGFRGRNSKDPSVGDCDVVTWFICDALSKEFFPWLPNVPSPSVQPWKSTTVSSTRPTQRPVPGVSVSQSFGAHTVCWGLPVTTRPSWLHVPRWERAWKGECVLLRERVLCLLKLSILRLGRKQKLFQNNLSASQAFMGLHWPHPLAHDLSLRLDWQDSVVQYRPLHIFTSLGMCLPPFCSVPSPQWSVGEWIGGFLGGVWSYSFRPLPPSWQRPTMSDFPLLSFLY